MNWKIRAACALVIGGLAASANGAEFRTANFEVIAEESAVAEIVGQAAEDLRLELARRWLSEPIGNWTFRCRITVAATAEGGSGLTTYEKFDGRLKRIGIQLQGPLDRLMDYVLPHELTHAVLITALEHTPPRWADEGAAMLSESRAQRLRQRLVVEELVKTKRAIPLREVLRVAEYPRERRANHAFYSQSLALTEFLTSRGGYPRFLQFVRDGYKGDWDRAVSRHYRFENVEALQREWTAWVQKEQGQRQAKRVLVSAESG